MLPRAIFTIPATTPLLTERADKVWALHWVDRRAINAICVDQYTECFDAVGSLQDLTINWTGGIPGTQVTAVGSSGTMAILCAADVSSGKLTIPSYVLMNLPPTGSTATSIPGQLTVGNGTPASLFTATGLDLAWVHFGETYTLTLKYQ